MLTLTDNARDAVHDLAVKAGVPDGGGLRIAESTDHDGSFELALVPRPEPDDAVVESGGTLVFVESATVQALSGLVLDTAPVPDDAPGSARAVRPPDSS
jgi:Fe-S cluster assembly iron-binding protein IscA